MTPNESALRTRLGVPADARTVLLFAETSHWDPNWLHTSEEYLEKRVRHTLDAVLRELEKEPRRVFSIECTFFLRLYWERYPELRERLRTLIDVGRIRLSGTGVTTPDTLLPGDEAILRDYLAGREWLRSQGIAQEPRLAYLPDNFGHSPALPSLLTALGLRYAAVSRVDGMHFPGDDYRLPGAYPRRGSSAELLRALGSLDFRWRAPDGSETLCHWNAFTYFQGDMLAYGGIIRWMGRVFGWTDRSERHVARRIASYVRRLRPLSKTPYLFCPIGCDFNDPIPDLLALLDRENRVRYPTTGVWVVNAALEDYLDLVAAQPVELPTLELDPNPYWMGFYSTRPQMKRQCRRIVRTLVDAERVLARADSAAPAGALPGLRRAWDRLVVSNHHDFITGTTPDRVYRAEQAGWLDDTEAAAHTALRAARAHAGHVAPRRGPSEAVSWHRDGSIVEIVTPFARVRLDERVGGCITGWWPTGHDDDALAGPSNDLVAYRDSGGLWRMGHEFRGGTFRAVARTSDRPAVIEVEVHPPGVRVVVTARLEGRDTVRTLWFDPSSPAVRLEVHGAARRRRTVTARFVLATPPTHLDMDVPGGVVRRELRKHFDPTFWCATHFVHAHDEGRPGGLAVLFDAPGGLAANPRGHVEWVVLRNAPREKAFGFVPVLAHPAWGANDGPHGFEAAVWPTGSGDWRENGLHRFGDDVFAAPLPVSGGPAPAGCRCGFVTLDHPDVLVRAVKHAEDGRGLVVRLVSYAAAGAETRLTCAGGPVRHAVLCDALERDGEPLTLHEGRPVLTLDRTILSLRLHLDGDVPARPAPGCTPCADTTCIP